MNRLTEEVQIGPFASLKDKAEAWPEAFNTYECLYAHMTAVTKLKKYEDTGLEPEELVSLVTAINDDRFVELPCKIGDKVFCFRNHGGKKIIHQGKVSEMLFVHDEGQMKLQIVVWGIARGTWGKNIFATLEDAKAALEGGA